jgi:hypothetical protein
LGDTVAYWQNLTPSASGTIFFVPDQTGTYLVTFDGDPTYHIFTTLIAATSVYVLPECVLGTLSAVACGFVAVGVYSLKAKRFH